MVNMPNYEHDRKVEEARAKSKDKLDEWDKTDKELVENIAEEMYSQHKYPGDPRWQNVGSYRREQYLTFAKQIIPIIKKAVEDEWKERLKQEILGNEVAQLANIKEAKKSVAEEIKRELEEKIGLMEFYDSEGKTTKEMWHTFWERRGIGE